MNLKDKNILITGANGFVGSYLAEELINNGSNVHGLIRKGNWRFIFQKSNRSWNRK